MDGHSPHPRLDLGASQDRPGACGDEASLLCGAGHHRPEGGLWAEWTVSGGRGVEGGALRPALGSQCAELTGWCRPGRHRATVHLPWGRDEEGGRRRRQRKDGTFRCEHLTAAHAGSPRGASPPPAAQPSKAIIHSRETASLLLQLFIYVGKLKR